MRTEFSCFFTSDRRMGWLEWELSNNNKTGRIVLQGIEIGENEGMDKIQTQIIFSPPDNTNSYPIDWETLEQMATDKLGIVYTRIPAEGRRKRACDVETIELLPNAGKGKPQYIFRRANL